MFFPIELEIISKLIFRKYEVNIEVFTNKILNKIDKNEAITIEEIKDLIFVR